MVLINQRFQHEIWPIGSYSIVPALLLSHLDPGPEPAIPPSASSYIRAACTGSREYADLCHVDHNNRRNHNHRIPSPDAMSGFRAVNTTLTVTEPPPRLDETTPTTPRPTRFATSEEHNAYTRSEDAFMKTPTKDSFGGIAGQRPLPTEPLTSTNIEDQPQRNSVSRESSHRSTKSLGSAEDIEMRGDNDGKDASDNESTHSDSRPSKKKKGQRFFCTDFPPCQLSFTRSEHLARHIR